MKKFIIEVSDKEFNYSKAKLESEIGCKLANDEAMGMMLPFSFQVETVKEISKTQSIYFYKNKTIMIDEKTKEETVLELDKVQVQIGDKMWNLDRLIDESGLEE